MRKILLIAGLALSSIVFSSFDRPTIPAKETTVYICTGGSSKKYHSSPRCSGLRKCGGEIKEIDKSKAESMGRTPCKICYLQN